MPTALTSLTVAEWDKLKKDSGIEKTPTLKALLGGSASVGPAIGNFQKARAPWVAELAKKKSTWKTGEKYFAAADSLSKALDKFEKIKDLSTPAVKTMKDSVAVWKKEALAVAVDQAKYLKANEKTLKDAEGKDMRDILGSTGIGGKQQVKK